MELLRVTGADVGGTALQVLGVSDATHLVVDSLVAEAGVDEDGAADGLTGRFQQVTYDIVSTSAIVTFTFFLKPELGHNTMPTPSEKQ